MMLSIRSQMGNPAMLSTTLLLIIAIFGLIEGAEYVHQKLSAIEIEDALAIAKNARSTSTDETANKPQRPTKEQVWYEKADATSDRFKAIGTLYITKVLACERSKPGKSGKVYYTSLANASPAHCTAFFVGPDILATAAHCLQQLGVTESSKHILFFRQQYVGGTTYTDEMADIYERVIEEWVYPKEYSKDPASNESHWASKASGFDYAFLRTNRKMEGDPEKDHLTLVSPNAYTEPVKGKHTALLIPGYPREYTTHFELVTVHCKLMEATDPLVAKDQGIKKWVYGAYYETKDAQDRQLICLGETGNMGPGGSGAPFMLDETAIAKNDGERAKKLKWVVGISAWGFKRGVKDEATDEECKASFTTWLREKPLTMYQKILATPKAKSFLETL